MNTQIKTNGITLNVVQEGPEDGPLLIFLHGFPEFSYAWKAQIPVFAEQGYRVWAPDQRGSNLSDKPKGVAAYTADELAADIIGLIDAAGEEQAYLVGHDWGAFVTWWIAAKYPERVKGMVILNVPHGKVMKRNLKENKAQRKRSRYMVFFQLPWLPERLAKHDNWKLASRALTSTSLRGTFSEYDLYMYRQAWSQPRGFHSTLNWYRAAFRKPSPNPKTSRISVPTLLIWGKKDIFLGSEMAQESIDLCDDGQLVMMEDASHWLHHEKPEQVNQLISEFFKDAT